MRGAPGVRYFHTWWMVPGSVPLSKNAWAVSRAVDGAAATRGVSEHQHRLGPVAGGDVAGRGVRLPLGGEAWRGEAADGGGVRGALAAARHAGPAKGASAAARNLIPQPHNSGPPGFISRSVTPAPSRWRPPPFLSCTEPQHHACPSLNLAPNLHMPLPSSTTPRWRRATGSWWPSPA